MADEAVVSLTLRINKRSADGTINQINYNKDESYQLDVTGIKGPTPGALTIPTGGKIISFAELVTPGLCLIKNMDDTNYVEYGVLDRDLTPDAAYTPFELGPGEAVVLKLSRNLGEEWIGTGTGTGGATSYNFFIKANTADVVVSIEAFER